MDIWKWRPKDTFEYLQLTLSSHKLTLVNSQCSGPLPPVARLKRDKKIKSQGQSKSKSSPLTPIQWDKENAGKIFAFPKLKIQFGADETQVGLLPSQTSEVAEVTNFIVAGSHEKWIWNYFKTPLHIECFNKCKKKRHALLSTLLLAILECYYIVL